MTYEEFKKKLDSYKASDASVDVKQKAIAKLEAEYYGTSANPEVYSKIVKDIREGAADISDIGN